MHHYLQTTDHGKWHLLVFGDWVVLADWCVGGWILDAFIASRPFWWSAGRMVVARD